MNDEIFSAMSEQMVPSEELLKDLAERIDAEPLDAPAEPVVRPPRSRFTHLRWLAPVAAAGAAVALIVPFLGQGTPAVVSDGRTAGAGQATDYAALYQAVRDAAARSGGVRTDTSATVGGLEDAAPRAPMPSKAQDTWQTNTQVQGIDEGDIVKSDGHSIFVASGKKVSIVAADGPSTRLLARIDTTAGEAGKTNGDRYTVRGPVVELVLWKTTLAVLVTEYQPTISDLPGPYPGARDGFMVPFTAALTKVLLYDISDPSHPHFQGSLGQSGGVVTTRLAGDLLYVVTEYVITDPDGMKPDDPATFVPVLTDGAEAKPARIGDCGIMPAFTGPRYAVVTSINLGKRARVDSESVLGGSASVYMATDNLYLAAPQYDPSAAELTKAGAPKELQQAPITHLARISVNEGRLDLAAQGSVPGTVLNQFALDEYEGNLRVVTTVEGGTKKNTWVQRAALYVLGSNLKRVGSISALAKDESVRSVRFAGGIGYVVTFHSVDPLFAIDLSVPAQPRVLSALKIPGFSSYLHPWGEGSLLGLGRNVTARGDDKGLKLSMFNVADPLAVSEVTTVAIKEDDSEALLDHKAVLADPSSGLIGFPTTSWSDSKTHYQVYRYDPAGGFSLAKQLGVASGDDVGSLRVRGIIANGYLYVIDAKAVAGYQVDGFDSVAKVSLKG